MTNENQNIISDLRNGDSSSFKKLYGLYFPSVKKFILKNSGAIDDAKDNFQDTLLVLVEKLRVDDFELTASLKTYIIAISKNLWFKKLRNISYRKEIEFTDVHSDKFYCDISSSIDNEKTYWEKLQFYLTKITSHCNRLLHLMFFKNKSIEDIQAEYGYSSKHNAQNQKHRCIEQVRKIKEADEIGEK